MLSTHNLPASSWQIPLSTLLRATKPGCLHRGSRCHPGELLWPGPSFSFLNSSILFSWFCSEVSIRMAQVLVPEIGPRNFEVVVLAGTKDLKLHIAGCLVF